VVFMILSFVNAKGGAGKTTTVMHLAHIYAERGSSVLVVDADVQGSASSWSDEAAASGTVLPFEVVSLASASLIERRIDGFAARHDLVLIDPGPNFVDIIQAAISMADLAVIPLNARPDDIRQAVKTAAECSLLTVPCVALLNRVKTSETSSIKSARLSLADYDVAVMETVVADWTEIGHAFGSRVTSAAVPVWQVYTGLAAELDGVLTGMVSNG
jgi:chromosome partitioning protein